MAAKMEVNDIDFFNTDAHWDYSILEPGASTFNMCKENSNCDFSMKTSRTVVMATAHSRDVFSISIQEINIWIFSNLVLNLSQSVI